MSIKNWSAGIIRPIPVSPTGPYEDGAAPGVWTLDQAAYWQKQGLWPTAGKKPLYWMNTIGTVAGPSRYNSVAVDSSGNVYACGSSNTSGTNLEFFITKCNSEGVLQWQRTIGLSNGTDTAYGIAVSGAGNVYVCGTLYISSSDDYDVLVLKYDTSGTLQWQRTLRTSAYDEYGYAIAIDVSENVYICGSEGNYIYYAKYNSSGVFQWQKTNNNYVASYKGIVATSSSLYVIGRESAGGLLVMKANTSDGTMVWQKITSTSISASGIAIDSSENLYICGGLVSGPLGNRDAYVAKFNSSGVVQWQRNFGDANYNEFYGIAVDSSANVYLASYGNSSAGIVKYDTSGTLLWQRQFAPTQAGQTVSASCIAITPANDIIVGGNADYPVSAQSYFTASLIRISQNGTPPGTLGTYNYTTTSLTSNSQSFTYGNKIYTSTTSNTVSSTSTLTSTTTSLVSYVVVAG